MTSTSARSGATVADMTPLATCGAVTASTTSAACATFDETSTLTIGDNTGTLTISSAIIGVVATSDVFLTAGNLSSYTGVGLNSSSISIAQIGDPAGVIDINAAGNITTTATSTINLVPNTIFTGQIFTNNGTTGLAYGSAAPYSVGIDGPFLFG